MDSAGKKSFTREDLMLPLGQPSLSPRQYEAALDSHRSANTSSYQVQSDIDDGDVEAAVEQEQEKVEGGAPKQVPIPISYAVSVDKFREIFETSSTTKALERIRKDLASNPDFNAQVIRFITEGSTAFNVNLFQYWNTMITVSMFMAIIAATIAVGFTSHFAGIKEQFISGDSLRHSGRAFFVLWASTAAINLTSLVINLMAVNQYKLMLHVDDMVWFISTWGWWTITLPWLLVLFGALTAIAGVVVGVAITADLMVAAIVAGVSGLLVLLAVVLWLCMISYNKDKEQDALDAIRRVLLKQA